MKSLAVAAPSQLAADAALTVAAAGGNAVDAAVASTLVAMVTEPGVCALGGGGFVTVWAPNSDPITIDGYMEMPGRGLGPESFGLGSAEVSMEYGGGLTTLIGHGSVGTPGGLEALSMANRQFGTAPWSEVMAPVVETARVGFPLSEASANYLTFSGESVFGRDPVGRAALLDGDRVLTAGEIVRVEGLFDSLSVIASEGIDVFYRGEIGAALAEDMAFNGGIVTRRDLEDYQAILRHSLVTTLDNWTIATNPGPAIGGATLSAMLRLMAAEAQSSWSLHEVDHFVQVQRSVMGFRREHLDEALDREPAIRKLLATAATGDWRRLLTSPSTVHVSAVDSHGIGCAITMSAGYGSGVTVPGTGIWLNNSLGEIELNRHGYHALQTGSRLISNMAPTVARDDQGARLAIGSPGADRITTALSSVMLNLVRHGMGLQEAIDHPRLHVVLDGDFAQVAYEAGLPVDDLDLPATRYDEPHMYFGGVGAAMMGADGTLQAAADARRTGGTVIV